MLVLPSPHYAPVVTRSSLYAVLASVLHRQLEIRLGFSFLPGLSWPGQQQQQQQQQQQHHGEPLPAAPGSITTAAAAAAGHGTSASTGTSTPVVVRRRNLAGLPPPVGKNAAEAAEADAAAAAAAAATAAAAAGGAGAVSSSSYVSPDSTKRGKGVMAPGSGGGGGRGAMEDGNYSSTDDEAGAGVIGLRAPRGELYGRGSFVVLAGDLSFPRLRKPHTHACRCTSVFLGQRGRLATYVLVDGSESGTRSRKRRRKGWAGLSIQGFHSASWFTYFCGVSKRCSEIGCASQPPAAQQSVSR